jgi:uncharacterized protein
MLTEPSARDRTGLEPHRITRLHGCPTVAHATCNDGSCRRRFTTDESEWSTEGGGVLGWVRTHQLTTFFVLTFAFSWVFWVPSACMFAGTADPNTLITSPLFVALQTLGAAGPTAVAIALTFVLHGKDALGALVHRFKPMRSMALWYVTAALLAPTLTLIAMALDALLRRAPFVHPDSGLAEMAAEMGWLGALAVLPIVLVSQLLSSPLLEEAGWRGFALPRMQARWTALASGVLLGALWGCWHLPLVIAYGDPFGPYLTGIVAYSVLMTWVFNSGRGNLLLMLVFHAALNLSLNVLLPLGAGWTPALVASGAALIVVFWHGPQSLSARIRFVSG